MGLSLESMAIEMPTVFGHPNRVAFRGVLTLVDVASDRAPSGARGHRVTLTRKAAEEAIPSLLGMALDYSPRFDTHDTRRKIGVITRAEIVGREIAVSGFLYGRDFPEIVAEIGRTAVRRQPSAISRQPSAMKKNGEESVGGNGPPRQAQSLQHAHSLHRAKRGRDGDPDAARVGDPDSRRDGELGVGGTQGYAGGGPYDSRLGQVRAKQSELGMSYEIADAVVEDIKASVWVLTRVTFTGAAVLRRDKAAYRATWIELG